MSAPATPSPTPTTGASVLVDSLLANGVPVTMNIAGLGMWAFAEAAHERRDEMTYISAVNETSIALMAEGWGRATQTPALLNVYFASGTQLASVAMSTAWADRVPLILLTTTPDAELAEREPYAAVPGSVTASTAQYTKWSCTVESVRQIPELVRRAVSIATAVPRGPVHLSVPYRLLDALVDELPETVAVEVADPPIAPSVIERLAADLTAAPRPVILAGGEVGQYGGAVDLGRICELTGAVVVEAPGYVTHPPIDRSSEYRAGRLNVELDIVDQADFVAVIGCELTQVEFEETVLRQPAASVAHLATTPHDIGKQFAAGYAGWGDLGAGLAQLREVLESTSTGTTAPWRTGLREARRERRERAWAAKRELPGWEALERTVSDLPEHFGERLVVVDAGNTASIYVQGLEGLADRYYALSSKASMQGWGVPAGIGIQLARPEDRVVAVVGDGGFMFTSGALYTAARQDIPLVVIVVGNRGWGGGGYQYRIRNGYDGDLFIGDFDDPPIDIAAMAASMGVASYRLADPDEVPGVLAEVAASTAPAVIVVDIEPVDLRSAEPVLPPRTRGMSG